MAQFFLVKCCAFEIVGRRTGTKKSGRGESGKKKKVLTLLLGFFEWRKFSFC